MIALLIRTMTCAWRHRRFRTEIQRMDFVQVSCSKCAEDWLELRW